MKTLKARKKHIRIRKFRTRMRYNKLAKQRTQRRKNRRLNGGALIGQGNFGCFTADTKIKLTDGRNLSFLELIEENKQGKRNFTFTVDNNIIKIAEIKNPRKTKENAEIMNVIFVLS